MTVPQILPQASSGNRAFFFDSACAIVGQSMIRKKPAPDLIRGGYRFSGKIMRKQNARMG
jgi:hypothetical protein